MVKTEYIKVDFETEAGTQGIRRAAECIKDGGLVVFPTETVYGLGADGTSADAAKRIYEAKGRPSDNPLIIHIAQPEDASLYAETDAIYKALPMRLCRGLSPLL